jgi:hypothetical protein
LLVHEVNRLRQICRRTHVNSRGAEGLARKRGICALTFPKDHAPAVTKRGALSAGALQPIPFSVLLRDRNWRRIVGNEPGQKAERRIEPPDERIAAIPGVELESSRQKHGCTPVRGAGFLCETASRAPQQEHPADPPLRGPHEPKPVLVAAIKNSGIERLSTRASGRLGRLAGVGGIAPKCLGGRCIIARSPM